MDPLVEPLARQGVEVVPFYIGRVRHNPFAICKVFMSLRAASQSCDIVHAQYGSLCGFITAFLTNKKKVISLRGSDVYPVSVGSLWFRTRLLVSRILTALSLPFFDRIIVMSKDMERLAKKPFVSASVYVIPDGIDLDKFKPMDKAQARSQIGIAPDALEILYVSLAHDNPIKRKDLAEKAMAVARRSLPNARLLAPLNIDHDLMPAYVNASDLILCTSTHEGWPNCVKETLACNVPFVATDISDLKDVAARQPVCRVADADAQALGQAIVDVLQDGRKMDLRSEVRDMDVNHTATRLKSLYQSLL